MTYKEKLAHFRELCLNHDPAYSFSDDQMEWKKGRETGEILRAFEHEIKREDSVRIYNEVIGIKFPGPGKESFYWTL